MPIPEQIKEKLASTRGKQLQLLVDRACRKYGAGSEHAVRAAAAYDSFVYGRA